MISISTHILDTARGRPAANVSVVLEHRDADGWQELARRATDTDGRVRDLAPGDRPLSAGDYRLRFATADYFTQQGVSEFFYAEVTIAVRLAEGGGHYHVPLLLSPFGYSTYRGS
jgi:5-hydroxyisourate hydrolase